MTSVLIIVFMTCIASNAFSGQVEVVNAKVTAVADSQYRFDVTLKHDDRGWEHYANRWEILDTEGNILATRILHHPHVNEQPFTRSLTAKLPDNSKTVIIRGHDKVHQYGKKTMAVSIP